MALKKFQKDSIFFEELCNRYYLKIYNFCKKLSKGYNTDFAEECTQNTFLEARKQIVKLKNHPNIEGWLYTTARNQINLSFRKQYVRRKYESVFEEEACASIAVTDTNLEKLLEEDIDVDRLAAKVLKSLSKEEFALYQDYYKKHLKIIDLSGKYQISVTAVTTRIYRLKKKIKCIVHTYLEES